MPLISLLLQSGTLCLLTFALVLLLLPFMLFLKLISFLLDLLLIWTGFLANHSNGVSSGLHVFDPPWQLDLARLCGWHGFASSGC